MKTHDAGTRRLASTHSSPLPAVWFFPSDYVGFWGRLAIEVVDGVVFALILLVTTAAVALLDPANDRSEGALVVVMSGWAGLAYGYFVVLKHSRLRTVGYWMAYARLVDPYGRPPGLAALTLRLAFGLLGPLNIVLDMLWIPADRHKQALRDKFAHTYVVKVGAEPAGPARVVFRTHYIMGMSFVFRDIEPVSVGQGSR